MGAFRAGNRRTLSVTLRLPPTLADRIGVARVAVRAASVKNCLEELVALHPELIRMIWLRAGELNPVMLLFVNDALQRPVNFSRMLIDGDELDIVPSIEAG